ncbi:MAG: sugar phosphate isomerase/epimerase family protein [Christensenellales bacterium]|jgi:sugar phosphate isomerase/epimerase
MMESIHKYFQIGTIQWMSYPNLDALAGIRKIAADDYFDAIEISHFPDAGMRAQAKALLEQAHMRVCFGAQPMLLSGKLNPNDLDEEARMRAERTLIEAVDEAKYLGATGVAFLAGKWSEPQKEAHYEQLIKTTRAVCAHAADAGLIVELEVFDFDMDKAALIGPAPLAARFAADMRTYVNNFGLMVDLSHFPTTYETTRFAVQTMRPYITHFHIGNAVVQPGCEAYGDMHPRFGFPNSANDTPELTDFFRVLKQEGFFCADAPYVLSFEVKPWGDEDAEMVLAGTKRVINRAWALAE